MSNRTPYLLFHAIAMHAAVSEKENSSAVYHADLGYNVFLVPHTRVDPPLKRKPIRWERIKQRNLLSVVQLCAGKK